MHDGQNDGYSVRSDVFLAKVLGVPRSIPVSFFWTSETFLWDSGTFFGTPHKSGGFDCMTGRPTNGQTMNQRTDAALNLMVFFLKVSGDPKSIPVSFFGQVKCFLGRWYIFWDT